VFDGVHVGHQTLIRHAIEIANERRVPAVVCTFDRDPDQVVTPDSAAPQLLTLEDKLAYISVLGVDAIVVFSFCMRMASTTPERFLDDTLFDAVHPRSIVVGEDFRFGQHASGDVSTLRRYGAAHDCEVIAYPLVAVEGEPVTSTRVRTLIAAGDTLAAATLLGRPHRVRGHVVHGRGAGEPVLGVPTANVTPIRFSAIPADGVYAGTALIGEFAYPAGISVGVPPTFPESRDYLEAHLVGFDGDLYGRELILEFGGRLREQLHFDTPAELAERIRADLEQVKSLRDGTGRS
jgi:riboflavin kinase/FMN adenylyltransferase